MPPLARLIAAVALLAVAGFCAFGFAATFEPTNRDILPWRIGYGLAFAASLLAAGWLFWQGRRPPA